MLCESTLYKNITASENKDTRPWCTLYRRNINISTLSAVCLTVVELPDDSKRWKIISQRFTDFERIRQCSSALQVARLPSRSGNVVAQLLVSQIAPSTIAFPDLLLLVVSRVDQSQSGWEHVLPGELEDLLDAADNGGSLAVALFVVESTKKTSSINLFPHFGAGKTRF